MSGTSDERAKRAWYAADRHYVSHVAVTCVRGPSLTPGGCLCRNAYDNAVVMRDIPVLEKYRSTKCVGIVHLGLVN